MTENPPSFTCTLCWLTSSHYEDVEHGFCRRCHQYTPGVITQDLSYTPGRNVSYRAASLTMWEDGTISFGPEHQIPHTAIEDWEAVLRVAKQESARIRQVRAIKGDA